jgi:glutamyl-tRNA reductase
MTARPQWQTTHLVREESPVLAQLRQRAERIAQSELERTLAGMSGESSDEQRQLLEAMGRAIVDKLLHEPSRCLRTRAGGDEGQALRDAAARLFGLEREGEAR